MRLQLTHSTVSPQNVLVVDQARALQTVESNCCLISLVLKENFAKTPLHGFGAGSAQTTVVDVRADPIRNHLQIKDDILELLKQNYKLQEVDILVLITLFSV